MRAVHLVSLLASLTAPLACGGDSSGSGGGASTTGSAGGGGSTLGYPLPHMCIGCGEYLTTSERDAGVCDGGASTLWEALGTCVCGACAMECAHTCQEGSPPDDPCTNCKLAAWQTVCAGEYHACAQDL